MPAMSSADHTAAMQAALRLLSFRARSEQELVERLRRRGFGAEVVTWVIQDLTGRGLVNDWAFASERARTRVLSHHVGPRRLKEELRHKGMSTEIIEATVREIFQEIDEEEVARARAQLKAGLMMMPESSAARFCQSGSSANSRGYSTLIIAAQDPEGTTTVS